MLGYTKKMYQLSLFEKLKKHPYKEIMVWPTTKTYAYFYISDRLFNECIFKNNQQKILVLQEY